MQDLVSVTWTSGLLLEQNEALMRQVHVNKKQQVHVIKKNTQSAVEAAAETI